LGLFSVFCHGGDILGAWLLQLFVLLL
jgi:hypothetical protein